ncbi:hypothetical protein DM02DRAFT_703803 [Periconia macrospinosa]|uniref:Uncharacterized protein n=1 Tax=Periconia macrospinosa TaxID=97972 RepID=A0A2V1DUR9_9PLEO|nr:hypothetical protein DM02DRAFT_703803 [Periconia macrospinosa]
MANTPQTELDDLGSARYDADTAAFGERDASAFLAQRIRLRPTHAATSLDPETQSKIQEWKTFQYVTDDVDEREERKGDLHGGQLHRENRAAARAEKGKGKGRGGRGGGRGGGAEGVGVLQAGFAVPGEKAPPLAKGFPEEVTRDEARELFWGDEIVKEREG